MYTIYIFICIRTRLCKYNKPKDFMNHETSYKSKRSVGQKLLKGNVSAVRNISNYVVRTVE